jgi:hypothetical protein
MLKKIAKRVELFFKFLLAFVIDVFFPLLDLVEALMLVLAVPKNVIEGVEKFEHWLVVQVEKLKEIDKIVDKIEDQIPEDK